MSNQRWTSFVDDPFINVQIKKLFENFRKQQSLTFNPQSLTYKHPVKFKLKAAFHLEECAEMRKLLVFSFNVYFSMNINDINR